MGSQTPEGHRRGPADAAAKAAITSIDPPKSSAANGLLEDALGGEATDDDDEFDGSDLKVDIKITNDESNLCLNALSQGQSVGKKKRKRSRNKKKMGSAVRQTRPPRVALSDVFKHQPFPEGQVVDYANRDENLQRTTNEELRHLSVVDNMVDQFFSDYRKAAETHRQVRQYVQAIAKPGITMSKLADEIEDGVRALVGHQATTSGDALEAGMGFPTGLCLNNVAAHWTPNPGSKEVVLQYDDVLSIDFGVHVNGRIVDSAFTIAHNPIYDNLLEGVKAATNTGLKMAGIDARISELSAEMQEVMESHEVTLNGKTIPIRAINNITGHNILRYKIHGDKQVPFVKSRTTQRMEEGDIFAIETFGSTGRGSIRDGVGVYGYGRNEGVSAKGLHHGSAKALLKTIEENFGTLVFSKRYLERVGAKNYHLGMKTLVAAGVVEQCGPLVDIPGSYVAQFEHTVLLRPNCKEIISRGDDY